MLSIRKSGLGLGIFLAGGILISLAGCAMVPQRPLFTVTQQETASPAPPKKRPFREVPSNKGSEGRQPASSSPRQIASLRLVDLGKQEIEAGKTDQGITFLERALSLDGYNETAYYYLTVAWLRKNRPGRALGFAQKAELLARGSPGALKKVYLIKSKIYRKLGKPEKAALYRQKARTLR